MWLIIVRPNSVCCEQKGMQPCKKSKDHAILWWDGYVRLVATFSPVVSSMYVMDPIADLLVVSL
jgi:hypothetical protein